MLRSAHRLLGTRIAARDGDIGKCRDFLFDDRQWTVRYLVVDTGSWLLGRRVVLSPAALGRPDWEARSFPVELTKERIENAPSLDEHAPVSRQYERQYAMYYGYPFYWGGPAPWGVHPTPAAYALAAAKGRADPELDEEERHTRSMRELRGYRFVAGEEKVGRVEDFLLDDRTWEIRFLVVDTGGWFHHAKVLVPPHWLADVDWPAGVLKASVPPDRVRACPGYDDEEDPLPEERRRELEGHYGLPRS